MRKSLLNMRYIGISKCLFSLVSIRSLIGIGNLLMRAQLRIYASSCLKFSQNCTSLYKRVQCKIISSTITRSVNP